MAGNVAPNIVTDGLVLYLDAANTRSYVSGSTTWNDISRSGNNGVLTNGPTFNSANGGSIVFDGVNDFVTFNNINLTNVTFEFWFSISNKVAGFHYVMNYGNNIAGQMLSISIANQNYLSLQTREIYVFLGGDDNSLKETNFLINYDTIYNVVLTASNGSNNLGFYVNGISYPISNSTILNLGSTFNLGRYISNNSNFLNGKIFSLKVYNRILNSTEVLQNYNATNGRFGL